MDTASEVARVPTMWSLVISVMAVLLCVQVIHCTSNLVRVVAFLDMIRNARGAAPHRCRAGLARILLRQVSTQCGQLANVYIYLYKYSF